MSRPGPTSSGNSSASSSATGSRRCSQIAWVTTFPGSCARPAAAEDAVRALGQANIPVLPFKGAALLLAGAYAPGERAMSDVDVMVPRPELDRARQVLLATGWEDLESPESRAARLVHHHHWRLRKPGTPTVVVELHWTPASGERHFPGFALLAEAADKPQGIAAGATQLYFLASNASWHAFTDRLLLLWDLRRWLEHCGTRLEWSHVHALTKDTRSERAVRIALACAHELLAAPVPEAERRLSRGERAVMQRLMPPADLSAPWKRRLLRVAVADSWGERRHLIRKGALRSRVASLLSE